METEITSSKLFADAVNELSKLPGVGRKTATRLVLHLLRQSESDVELLGNALIRMRSDIVFCKLCHNISDSEKCHICSDTRRDTATVCVVEGIQDVIAIENTRQFRGVFHVLGGVISPIDGISPQQLNIASLVERVAAGGVNEIIFALPTTMEGDTTGFYLFRKLSGYPVNITTIAKGVSVGDELQYADEITLGQSLLNRRPFQSGN
ncbi:MAG TPA: recombination mediator RecR [Bacteroidales bacterium]|nr:recombination mediator RecR [Bacteroidales bacterium]